MYTLDELTARAGEVLDALGVRAGSRRVRQRPDGRTVRYYAQHGLVDRPLAVSGREARYSRRHLAQVVAVKRLQAAGVSLTEIQRRLAGVADGDLLAAIGPGAESALRDSGQAGGERPAGAGERAAEPLPQRPGPFWRARPAAGADLAPVGSASAPRQDTAREVIAVPLVRGVELTFDVSGWDLDAARVDVASLRAAARPLLGELHRLGMPARTADEAIIDDEGNQR